MKFRRKGTYCVYILKCKDGTYYTGYTRDLKNRIKLHNSGRGAKYTKGRGPARLVFRREFKYYKIAVRAERDVKKLTRAQKTELIRKHRKTRARRVISSEKGCKRAGLRLKLMS